MKWKFLFYCFLVILCQTRGDDNVCEKESCQKQKELDDCSYDVIPLSKVFGAEIKGIDLKTISTDCATKLREEAYMYRFLLFKNQTIHWREQIDITSSFGTPFQESSSSNRAKHDKIPDPRLGFFSNDHTVGLTGIGIEGWHVDGNCVNTPHLFTLIYCVQANTNGPTLLVPLKEIVDMLTDNERVYLDSILFVSKTNTSVNIPLLYKHPFRNDDTLMVALGSLSGQYLQINKEKTDEPPRQLSVAETQYIQDLLHAKILGSNMIYTVNYDPGDFLMIHNPSVAHLAGPGTQTPPEISGRRLIHRSSIKGEILPSRSTRIRYECSHLPPYDTGYCYFSLRGSVYYPRVGFYDDYNTARQRCKNIHKHSDLATIPNKEWNEIASKVISETKVPHWTNATNPQKLYVLWGEKVSDFTNWDRESGQPNDHDGPEDCVVIGPNGFWFDLPCSGPKTAPGTDRAPVMIWDDRRDMRNVYPLCGIEKERL